MLCASITLLSCSFCHNPNPLSLSLSLSDLYSPNSSLSLFSAHARTHAGKPTGAHRSPSPLKDKSKLAGEEDGAQQDVGARAMERLNAIGVIGAVKNKQATDGPSYSAPVRERNALEDTLASQSGAWHTLVGGFHCSLVSTHTHIVFNAPLLAHIHTVFLASHTVFIVHTPFCCPPFLPASSHSRLRLYVVFCRLFAVNKLCSRGNISWLLSVLPPLASFLSSQCVAVTWMVA